MPVTYNSR